MSTRNRLLRRQDPPTGYPRYASAIVETNSLVPSDVRSDEYNTAKTIVAATEADVTDYGGGLTQVGLGGTSATYRNRIGQFVVPSGSGITSVTLRVRARKHPDDASAQMRMFIGTATADPLVPAVGSDNALNDTVTEYTVTAPVTAGTVYTVGVSSKHPTLLAGVAQRFLVESIRLTPNDGEGLWAGTFYRHAVHPDWVNESNYSAYNYRAVAGGCIYRQSPFARLSLLGPPTQVAAEHWSNQAAYPDSADVGLFEHGSAASSAVASTASAISVVAFTPTGAGQRRFDVVVGGQTTGGDATVEGVFLRAVYTDALCSVIRVPTSLVIYGDSITVGAEADSFATEAWPVLMRTARRGVAVEAWGYRTLNDDCATAGARTTFATQLTGYDTHRYWLAIGGNDYGLNKWTAADFGTAYAATLDAIRAADSTAVIYCQTPTSRSTETANASGSTLGNYRTEIATAANARDFCVLVDGTALIGLGDLADGTHPTTAGHAAYAAAVKAVLGW